MSNFLNKKVIPAAIFLINRQKSGIITHVRQPAIQRSSFRYWRSPSHSTRIIVSFLSICVAVYSCMLLILCLCLPSVSYPANICLTVCLHHSLSLLTPFSHFPCFIILSTHTPFPTHYIVVLCVCLVLHMYI